MVQFDKPREEINGFLKEMTIVVQNLITILETEKGEDSINHNFTEFLTLMLEKIDNNKFTLMRDYLKCVFVGRTSNGKSSVINALLKRNDLPVGIGHTTNCCLLMHSGGCSKPFIEFLGEKNQKNTASVSSIDSLKSKVHALSNIKINMEDIIKVTYPNDMCPIIKQNVYFFDSPGIDIEPSYDDWIDKHCLDSDLFVLVCNAESILMQCEKNFFFKVKNKFLMPNVIIVNNRWDSSVDQPDDHVEQVKNQQMKKFSDFLVRELNVCSESEVKSRVFFVSALEELKSQRGQIDLDTIPGRLERKKEFERLVKTLENYLSTDSLNKKLLSNFKGMEEVLEQLNSFINCLFNTIVIEKEMIQKNIKEQVEFFNNMNSHLSDINEKALILIENIVQKAKEKVVLDFRNLVCDLDLFTNSINVTFNPYNRKEYLDYQKFLVEYVENSIINDLNMKTIAGLNNLLKSGFELLTMTYTELILVKNPIKETPMPLVSSCPSPIPTLYPEFFQIMNEKINNLKGKIIPIPEHFTSYIKCMQYLESIDNRFISGNKSQIDDITATGATIAAHSDSKFPKVTLMVPKFSSIVLTDFIFSPGFHFSLSPFNIRWFFNQWSQSLCPLKSKLRLIKWKSLGFCCMCGGICYTILIFNNKFWKLGLLTVLSTYFYLLGYEKYFWNSESEMMSLKNQFIVHVKVKMETIIHISAITTARQLGSFLHLDLTSLDKGVENIINDFQQQIDVLMELDANIIVNEKKIKKVKSNMSLINQQISTFKKVILDPKYGLFKNNYQI